MKVYLQYWIMTILSLACLWPSQKERSEQETVLSSPPFFCTKAFIDSLERIRRPDTLVVLSAYDFTEQSVLIPFKKKQKIVDALIAKFFPLTSHFYISDDGNYWKRSRDEKDFVEVKCHSCQYDDFYFTDLDKDGNLDIVYSSLINDYVKDDSNKTLIFREVNGQYRLYALNGFVRSYRVMPKSNSYIVFEMASIGCCDDTNYHLHSDTLFTKTWKFLNGKGISFKHNEVDLKYPSKDCL